MKNERNAMTDVKKLIAEFDRYFTSANSIDVDARISVPRDEWRALRAAMAQRLEADEWQPIGTAPKDESWLLLWEQYSNVPFVGCWSNRHKKWKVSNEHVSADGGWDGAIVVDCISMPITHWKPLQKGPQ